MRETATKRDWGRVGFGDLVRKVSDRVDPETSGLERYVAGEHMDTDDLRIRRWGIIDDGYLGPSFHMRFKPGQVLYGSRRTYLRKVAVADFEGITANTTFVLEPKDPNVLLPELLPFVMQTESFHEHSIKQSKGSVNPYINFSDLAWYEFALPPLDEQRRITELFEAARSVEESIRRIVDVAAQSRAAYLSSRELKSDRERIPLGGLLAAIEPGRSLSGANTAPGAEEFGVLKVSAVDPNGFQPRESKVLLDPADFDPQHQVHRGDLLMTRANTAQLVGETCIVHDDVPNLMLSDKTLRLVPADASTQMSCGTYYKEREFEARSSRLRLAPEVP